MLVLGLVAMRAKAAPLALAETPLLRCNMATAEEAEEAVGPLLRAVVVVLDLLVLAVMALKASMVRLA